MLKQEILKCQPVYVLKCHENEGDFALREAELAGEIIDDLVLHGGNLRLCDDLEALLLVLGCVVQHPKETV